MSLYEPTTFCPALAELNCAEENPVVAGPSTTSLFTETCNRMEADMEWLTAGPRAESDLLLRYFSDRVSRIKELLEYREILSECIGALAREGRVIEVVSNLSFAPTEPILEGCA